MQRHQLDEAKWHKEGAGANQCVHVCACVCMHARACTFAHVSTCK